VVLVDRPDIAGIDFLEVVLLGQAEKQRHVLMEMKLIVLDRQYIVGFLLDDLLGQVGLTAHGINRHDAPADIQQA